MVRILFALLLLQVSCFSEEGVYRNLEKRVKYFNSANFEGIEFNRLYILKPAGKLRLDDTAN